MKKTFYFARKLTSLFLILGFYSPLSSAQVYFEESFFPVYVSKNDAASLAGGSNTKSVPLESGLGIDTHTTLAYIWNSMIFGMTYNYYKVDTTRPLTPDYEGLTSSTGRQEFGPTFGYLLGPWRILFTYFVSAKKETLQKYTDPTNGNISTDESYANSGGSGYQVGLGYTFGLGAGFGISPTLIYRNVTYSKQSYTVRTGSGTPYSMGPLQTKAVEGELKPMISLSYIY